MDIFLLIVRLALAGVFGVAGLTKIFDPAGTEKAAADFGVPASLAKYVAYLLPAIELLIAASLFFVQFSWFGAIGAAVLLLIFTAAMAVQMAKGNAPDCHCFGQIHSEPVGAGSVLRNVALLILSLSLVVSGRAYQGVNFLTSSQDIMLFALGLGVITLLTIAVAYLKKISDQQVQIMRRIELMELVAREGGPVEREEVSHPHEGLPIGAVFPDFALPDLSGELVSLTSLRADALPVLFSFISPNCNPCNALVPEFEQWQKDLAGKVNFVFVSSGNKEDNAAKFGGGRELTVLLQKERELAESVHAKWTPTAILMDASGRVASHVAAGDSAIRALIDDIKSRDLQRDFTYFTNGNGHSHSSKIGEAVPEFSVADIKGNELTSDFFKGRRTLVTFWSHTCPYCLQMLADLREWDKTKGEDEPSLVVFSDGGVAENEKFGLTSPVIVDEGYKTAGEFGMFGTPSAVLVNEDGRIVSETAVGASYIWSLIGRQK
jgi:thiol-disulfide isomerase/thioredoxin/uncharacterized membrane protein YphA (DoxX/SURF4 family)